MKKAIIFLCFLFLLIGFGIYYYVQNHKSYQEIPSSNYTAEKTSIKSENTIQNSTIDQDKTYDKSPNNPKTISDFSTKLPHDTKERYSNIKLACKTLDGTIVQKGETFSLWNTLGCPTKEKGYRKAKAFTSTGKIRYSYGGGICQVSTTIYNALLELKGIKILERHEHSRDVTYIKDGKDAAVSYKTADLKFKNTLDYDIRLRASVKKNKVIIKIEKI